MIPLGNSWDILLAEEFKKPYYKSLREYLKKEYYDNHVYRVFPPPELIFNALRLTDYNDVRVVIIGQDPYHEYGQAHGLAFSVQEGVAIPPSLRNIYTELSDDLGVPEKSSGCLEAWAKQGVLLLNDVLTVREGCAGSHSEIGWQRFTGYIIELLNKRDKPMVFMLWGSNAKRKAEQITNPRHLILTAPHPSPLSAYRGFMGCRHFSKANSFLFQSGQKQINW